MALPSIEECVCCCEIDEVSDKKQDHPCIIGHPGFSTVCLDQCVLQTAYYGYRQEYGQNKDKPINQRYRYIAYRQLARWCWGYLGKDVRVPLPSCAVNRIREEFPSPDYDGFKPHNQFLDLD